MTWVDEQLNAESLENENSRLITKQLEGSLTPTYEGVIRLLKKGVRYEKVQSEKRELPG